MCPSYVEEKKLKASLFQIKSLFSLLKKLTGLQDGSKLNKEKYSIYLAKPSLSHKSFQYFGVTKFPNHIWDISWATTRGMFCCVDWVLLAFCKKFVSLYKARPKHLKLKLKCSPLFGLLHYWEFTPVFHGTILKIWQSCVI